MVTQMKKIILLFIVLSTLIGCSLSNSPTSKVEDLLTKYQTLDEDIENGISSVIEEETLTPSQRERYRKKPVYRLPFKKRIVLILLYHKKYNTLMKLTLSS